jgi:hypothetical protein
MRYKIADLVPNSNPKPINDIEDLTKDQEGKLGPHITGGGDKGGQGGGSGGQGGQGGGGK